MKRIIVFIISLIILISYVPFGSVGADELPLKEKKELQLIVKYKPGRIAAKSYRMENVERLKSDINIITAKTGDLDILYSQLKADKSVEYVEKNGYLTLHSIPNDKFTRTNGSFTQSTRLKASIIRFTRKTDYRGGY